MLRPPGILGLLGSAFDTSSTWMARVREILGPPAIQRPGHWPAIEDPREDYVDVEHREFPHAPAAMSSLIYAVHPIRDR